jgi:hypothetical protein
MRDENGTKWLPPARLIEFLGMLPADSRVMTNAVGSLTVLCSNGQRYLAYIDFGGNGEIALVSDVPTSIKKDDDGIAS